MWTKLLIFNAIFLLTSSSYVFESFPNGTIGTTWIVSSDSNFVGKWELEPRKADYSNGSIYGIVTKSLNARHAISIKKEFTATSDNFVLQFEHKSQANAFACGGSYIKVLSADFDPQKFNNEAPFVIMFGPDKCGGETNLVQFIYRTQNPLSKVWVEHKLKTKVVPLYDNITHVYTLVLKKDDTFEIKVDNKVKTSGSLHDGALFDTPFEPPKLIPDEKDKKPADWVDTEEIPDVNDTKPADWDETAPPTIPDSKAVKPEDWKEEEPLQIIDSSAVKPEEWNDEEDGPYKSALIDNPYCAEHGCGPWSAPQIKNPAFKGKWKPKMVPNPAFKGKWKPREVENPYFFTPEKTLYSVGQVYGLGFELVSPVEQWFSSVYVGDSVEEAEKYAKERWAPVNAAETAEKAEAKRQKKADDRRQMLNKLKNGSWRERAEQLAQLAQDVWSEHPVLTIVGIVVLIGVIVGLCVSCWACCCSGNGAEEEGGGTTATTAPPEGDQAGREEKKEEEKDDDKEDGDEEGEEKEEEDEEDEEEEKDKQKEDKEQEGEKKKK